MNLFEDTVNALKYQQGPYRPGESPLALAVLASKPWKPNLVDDICPACGEDKLTGSGENCPLNSKHDPFSPSAVEVELKKALYKRTFDDAINNIGFKHDGPLTPFVCIHRAVTMTWNRADCGRFDDIDAIAEALEQVLTDQGWLSEGQATGLDAINRAD